MAKKRDIEMAPSPMAAKLAESMAANRLGARERSAEAAEPALAPESLREPVSKALEGRVGGHSDDGVLPIQRMPATEVPTTDMGADAKPARGRRRGSSRLVKDFREARLMLSSDDDTMITEILQEIKDATGVKVQFSHLTRALLSLASRSVPAIRAHRGKQPLKKRPSNAEQIELAQWEDQLADFMLAAFRDRNRMDSE